MDQYEAMIKLLLEAVKMRTAQRRVTLPRTPRQMRCRSAYPTGTYIYPRPI